MEVLHSTVTRKGEEKESLEDRSGRIVYDFHPQCSVTQCHLMQRRLGNAIQLGGQEEEEMGLVNILPVSTTVSYCMGSGLIYSASIISLIFFYSSLFPISHPLFSILS